MTFTMKRRGSRSQRDVHWWHQHVAIGGLLGWWITAVFRALRGYPELAVLDYIAGCISYIAFGPKPR